MRLPRAWRPIARRAEVVVLGECKRQDSEPRSLVLHSCLYASFHRRPVSPVVDANFARAEIHECAQIRLHFSQKNSSLHFCSKRRARSSIEHPHAFFVLSFTTSFPPFSRFRIETFHAMHQTTMTLCHMFRGCIERVLLHIERHSNLKKK